MKLVYSFVLFFLIFQTSFAQKYEYNIIGEHFSDTVYATTNTKPFAVTDSKAIFEQPQDTTYIYHQVGTNENIEYILNLYQLCAPCFAKWNNLAYSDFNSFKNKTLYEGQYLKVALTKDYEKGTAETFNTRTLYQTFSNQVYIYNVAQQYGVSADDLRRWNNLNEYAYYVEEGSRLIVAKMEYKYACPCME